LLRAPTLNPAGPLPPPRLPPNRAVNATKVADNDGTGKIAWRNTVTPTELAATTTRVTGQLTVISPLGGSLANARVAVTGGTGTCTALSCPVSTLPFGDPVVCTFTCDPTVTAFTSAADIGGATTTGDATAVAVTTLLGNTSCVVLSDALFEAQDPAGWSDKQVCYDTVPNPYVVDFKTTPPSPLVTECVLGSLVTTYDVVNTAALALLADGTAAGSASATATVACPEATFTTTASGTVTKSWSWCGARGVAPVGMLGLGWAPGQQAKFAVASAAILLAPSADRPPTDHALPSLARRSLATSVVNAQNAQGDIEWGVAISNTPGADSYAPLTGTFTLRSPRAGALSGATVAGDAGACTATCPGTATAGVDVTCSYTCPGGTTTITPSVAVDGYVLTGAAKVVSWTAVPGPTGCVVLSDGLFAALEPSSWTGDRQVCWNSASSAYNFTFPTTPPAPGPTQCPTFASNYSVRRPGCRHAQESWNVENAGSGRGNGWAFLLRSSLLPLPPSTRVTQVTNEAVLKQSTNQAQLATDTQTATLPCPQALLTNSVSYVYTMNWYW
jgi:hypothetical protein